MNDGPLLTETPVGTYYNGDLAAAQEIIALDRESHQHPPTTGAPTWRVELCDAGQPPSEWGAGATCEEAWRYAIGAFFGPMDEEYDEEHLRRCIAAVADPAPDVLTPDTLERWLEC